MTKRSPLLIYLRVQADGAIQHFCLPPCCMRRTKCDVRKQRRGTYVPIHRKGDELVNSCPLLRCVQVCGLSHRREKHFGWGGFPKTPNTHLFHTGRHNHSSWSLIIGFNSVLTITKQGKRSIEQQQSVNACETCQKDDIYLWPIPLSPFALRRVADESRE